MQRKTQALKSKAKEDRRIPGVGIYFIDNNQSEFPLYCGTITKKNIDGTFVVKVVDQAIGSSKVPLEMTINGNKLHRNIS